MPNTGPRPRKPRKAEGAQIPYIIPQHEISFDAEAFDNLIKSQGIRLVHYRAIPDPRGMTSRGDTHDTLGIRDSSDGFIYREAGVVQVFFQNNPNSSGVNERGMLEVSSAYITLPRNYENTEEPIIADVFDRFFLKDIEIRVAAKQYVEASDTNVDRLQFPATCVEYIVDANGVYYTENIDFNINCDGYIEWISQHRPGFNPKTGRGTIYAIRYRYTPFFVVDHLVHEIRVAQITNQVTFDRMLERMPYQVFVMREKVFQDRNRDNTKKVQPPRAQQSPPSGGTLGPR
jgi:hypothetical protein